MAISAAVVGIGISAVGGAFSFMGASDAADAQKNIARQEQLADAQRKQQMELQSRRESLQALREGQVKQSLALTRATSQGAGGGTGLPGGQGQVAGYMNTNLLGISQNLEIGGNLFDINSRISQQKMNLADAGTMSSLGSGLTSLGSNIFSLGSGSLLSGFGSGPTPGYYGGSPATNPNLVPYGSPGNNSLSGIY